DSTPFIILLTIILFFCLQYTVDHSDLHSFPTRRSSDLLILKARSIEYLVDAGFLNVVEDKVWKQTITIPQSTPKGEELFNHITQYIAYLDDVEVDHVQEDTQLSSILVWALIGGAATKIAQ